MRQMTKLVIFPCSPQQADANFTNDVMAVIQIRWKLLFYSTVNCSALITTTFSTCPDISVVVVLGKFCSLLMAIGIELQQNLVSTEFELPEKNC